MKIGAIVKQIPRGCWESGLRWYSDANRFANYLSTTYKVSFDRVCGVLSALSPGCEWARNKQDAERLITCYVCGGDWALLPFGTYSANVAKAWAILTELTKEPAKFFNARTGAKTQAFYHNIHNPAGEEYVTIDRHMAAILSGRLGQPSGAAKITPKQYRELSSTLVRVAKRLGLVPSQLQAALWEYHLELIKQGD